MLMQQLCVDHCEYILGASSTHPLTMVWKPWSMRSWVQGMHCFFHFIFITNVINIHCRHFRKLRQLTINIEMSVLSLCKYICTNIVALFKNFFFHLAKLRAVSQVTKYSSTITFCSSSICQFWVSVKCPHQVSYSGYLVSKFLP